MKHPGPNGAAPKDWRDKVHEIIYESEKPEGKAFDIVLLFSKKISL